jgi:hypothetical protein
MTEQVLKLLLPTFFSLAQKSMIEHLFTSGIMTPAKTPSGREGRPDVSRSR